MQRAELEEMRQREANTTALLAIGPRKKAKTDLTGSNPVSYIFVLVVPLKCNYATKHALIGISNKEQ